MMSERLENFIRNNRKELDQFEAPENLWQQIELQLNTKDKEQAKKKLRIKRFQILIRVAAVVIIVLFAGLILFRHERQEASNLANINPHLARQQVYYASLIEEKQNELKQIGKNDPKLYHEFSSEIKKMDENYQKLKNDLPSSPNREKTVKAMIRNLQIQIEVLNQQLEIIDQVNQLKKEQQHDTQSI